MTSSEARALLDAVRAGADRPECQITEAVRLLRSASLLGKYLRRLDSVPLGAPDVSAECEHGGLRRQCPRCDDAETIAEMRGEIEELKRQISWLLRL